MMAAEEDALKRIVINKPDDAKDLIRYVQWNGIGVWFFIFNPSMVTEVPISQNR